MKLLKILAVSVALLSTVQAVQQPSAHTKGTPTGKPTGQLKPGEYWWHPELSPSGPLMVLVSVPEQTMHVYRNGILIGRSTVSTGSKGNATPGGVFSILEKKQEHYSKKYNNAPMPNMQRLTWSGIALHAGNLPGYPASHGCVRLPARFSSLLFGTTELGMTVVITSIPAVPSASDAPAVATMAPAAGASLSNAPYDWHPESSPAHVDSMVSVVISAADGKAVVMRNGVEIGSAPVRVNGELKPMAYVLRAWDSTGQHWLKLQFAGAGEGMEVTKGEGKRFETPVKFRYDVGTVLRPGSVIIVTPESLSAGSTGRSQTVIEDEPAG